MIAPREITVRNEEVAARYLQHLYVDAGIPVKVSAKWEGKTLALWVESQGMPSLEADLTPVKFALATIFRVAETADNMRIQPAIGRPVKFTIYPLSLTEGGTLPDGTEMKQGKHPDLQDLMDKIEGAKPGSPLDDIKQELLAEKRENSRHK